MTAGRARLSDVGRIWRVIRRSGSAQELHDRAALDDFDSRTLVLHEVTGPALVIGSTQDVASIDRRAVAAARIDVARRRSGGGAVLLGTDDHVWVDLVVPSGDPLADDDVERAAWWVGEAWAAAVAPGAGSSVEVHDRGVSDREAGRIACFAGVGPGEVLLDGRKVLGVSQRRTRAAARFQCVAYRRWDPDAMLDLLADPVASPGSSPGSGPSQDRPGGAEWRRMGSGGGHPTAGWGSAEVRGRVRDSLRSRAGAVLGVDWDVERDLLPSLP